MEHSAKSRPKVSICEHRQLVDASKSKKLAALANKRVTVLPDTPKVTVVASLKSESEIALQQAQMLIDARIHDIMNSFPEGRRNKLFSFRFGSLAKIHALEIKAAFQLLDIDAPTINWRLLAKLNYHGESV